MSNPQPRVKHKQFSLPTHTLAVLESCPIGVIAYHQGKFIYTNQAFQEMIGRSASYFKQREVLDVVPEDLKLQVAQIVAGREAGQRVLSQYEMRMLTAEQRQVDVMISATKIDLPPGSAVVAYVYDLTQIKATEKHLRENETVLRAVLGDQTEMVCRYFPDGRLIYVNDAYARFMGKSREQLVGQVFFPYVSPEDLEFVKKTLRKLTPQHPTETVVNRNIQANGQVRWVEWTDRGLFDELGKLYGYQAVGRDITQRFKAEEILREIYAKQAKLFAEIAHTLKTPLTVISGNINLLEHSLHRPENTEPLAHIRRQTDKAIDQVSQLLRIARLDLLPYDLQPRKVHISELIAEVHKHGELLLRSHFPNLNVTELASCFMVQTPGDSKAKIEVDPKHFNEALLMLIDNAIIHSRTESRLPHIKLVVKIDDKVAKVTISDQGKGISPTQLNQIKASFRQPADQLAQGGLGLRLAYKLISTQGGKMTISSKLERGTTCVITVPRV